MLGGDLNKTRSVRLPDSLDSPDAQTAQLAEVSKPPWAQPPGQARQGGAKLTQSPPSLMPSALRSPPGRWPPVTPATPATPGFRRSRSPWQTRPPGVPGVPGDPGAGHFYPPKCLDWNGLSGPGGLHGGSEGREAPKAVEATP
ncbi:hypothetical protein G7Z17_g5330 [Cylindrodendrum hubeiense]|uniref:Uncharacterized protein n=1 Tax=Cylindrodendrum hubeiense TaxID=595255 RepID=A0A9P5HB19_9HYPO|nr:hypothetical protein G7Z17_g5330 [Cylindrodendrum hubeiense]